MTDQQRLYQQQEEQQQLQQKLLRPIYNALDLHQFNKAYKLTQPKPQCDWPMTIALRAHASERCGGTVRVLESLVAIRDLLTVLSKSSSGGDGGGSVWGELDERIWLTKVSNKTLLEEEAATLAASAASPNNNSNGNSGSSGGGGGGGKGKRGKKNKNKKDVKLTPPPQSPAAAGAGVGDGELETDLDLVDVLDLTRQKRREILGLMADGSAFKGDVEDVAEETTLATIAVTLRSLRLHQTLATMYTLAAERLSSSASLSSSTAQYLKEELCTVLIQGYLSHLRVVVNYGGYREQTTQIDSNSNSNNKKTSPPPSITQQTTNERIQTLQQVSKSYECAQSAAMQLAKYSGSKLHRSWCAHAALMHLETCRELIRCGNDAAAAVAGGDEGEGRQVLTEEQTKKIEMKVSFLPRLAESLMSKVVSTGESDGEEGGDHPPSADDWNLYLKALKVQGKNEEAMNVLTNTIYCEDGDATTTTDTTRQTRKINDQNDVRNHLGSLIQFTERERLEQIAELYTEMDQMEEAADVYSNKLLVRIPDQWSYWIKLLENRFASLSVDGDGGVDDDVRKQQYDTALESCQYTVRQILLDQESQISPPHVPLRGPHLFRVEMASFGLRKGRLLGCGDEDDTKAVGVLCDAILEYATVFAPLVSCCFQDLRPYLQLLVERSCYSNNDGSDGSGQISKEAVRIFEWAKDFRLDNNPSDTTREGVEVVENEKDIKRWRRQRLRAYIASVKIMFEIWFQLTTRYDDYDYDNGNGNDDDKQSSCKTSIDAQLQEYIPSPGEMVQHWENALNLGSNPKDGGQKEFLPGDDLILLATQLLIYSCRHNQNESERRATYILAVTLHEHAMMQSPFNPYLKIAAINVYCRYNAIGRAWEIFGKIDIRQIQLDSCSYLILPYLLDGGLYKEAIQQAGNIISLHSTTNEDVGKFMGKSFENGNLDKGQEMITWKRYEMGQSLQLLQAKGLIMDLAPLLHHGGSSSNGDDNNNNPTSPSILGILHGLCGGNEDLPRATKIVYDSDNFYAAPSLLKLISNPENNNQKTITTTDNDQSHAAQFSDNRDLTINQFEILVRTIHPTPRARSISRAHMHGILTRVILLMHLSKAPKRGKVVKHRSGDSLDKRCRSLLRAIQHGDDYITKQEEERCVDDDGRPNAHLWKAIFSLSRVVCAVTAGIISENEGTTTAATSPPNDSLATREALCIPLLKSTTTYLTLAREQFELVSDNHNNNANTNQCREVSRLLAEYVVTLFTILKTTGDLFSVFGWGKRKRNTKVGAGALADVADALCALVNVMQNRMQAVLPSLMPLDTTTTDGSSSTLEQQQSYNKGEELAKVVTIEIENTVENLVGSSLPMKSLYLNTEKGRETLGRVVNNMVKGQRCMKERVEPFLLQMIQELKEFDVN